MPRLAPLVALSLALTIAPGVALADPPDLCPELERTTDNPDGNRDCGPGCIPETEFGFQPALKALNELRDHLFAESPPPDQWEAEIGNAFNLDVLKGTLLRMQIALAQATGAYSESYRLLYCDFLKNEANYLD